MNTTPTYYTFITRVLYYSMPLTDADVPWVLDPVAVGCSLPYRSEFALELCRAEECRRPTVIRANASEVMALTAMLANRNDEVKSMKIK